MGTEETKILAINAGSSSIKFDIFEGSSVPQRIIRGSVNTEGEDARRLVVENLHSKDRQIHELTDLSFSGAANSMIDWLKASGGLTSLTAIGHRVVHGGPKFDRPQHITTAVSEELNRLTGLDSEHMPAALELINMFGKLLADTPQIACFDTAFFRDLPNNARIIPLPRKFWNKGLRRYGFHGLSYTSLQNTFRKKAGGLAADNRVIYAHLGSGASITATKDGKPVDTTMGLTPASGIMMSTRSGDLDPGAAWFLGQNGLSLEEINATVNRQSGLLGVSETSADMYALLKQASSDERASEAVELFCYQAKKAIGALAASIGGLDSLVFSGGIGERSGVVRSKICAGLDYLGIKLDKAKNSSNEELISSTKSKVGVHVLPSDEAQVIAEQTILAVNQLGNR